MTMIEDKKYELIAAHLAGETDKEEKPSNIFLKAMGKAGEVFHQAETVFPL